jgi:hypothetical protein
LANTLLPAEYTGLAGQILAEAWGGPVRLGNSEEMKGSKRLLVYRCVIEEAPHGRPSSVIVKYVNLQPPDPPGEQKLEITPALINRDWAGLAFLNELQLAEPLAPRLYGGSKKHGLLVMEDLGGSSGYRLDHLLQGNDPQAAEESLLALMSSVGRLHALTVGKRDAYEAILKGLGTLENTDFEHYDFKFMRPAFEKAARRLGVTPQSGLSEELDRIRRILSEPGPFLAFTHGDPCPDNCLPVDGRMRLFDFELGNFRHALLDGVYSRFHFPSCWCVNRLSEDLWRRMEATYRAELVKGCPAAADDSLFFPALLGAGAAWTLALFELYDLEDLFERDVEWGISTARQRLLMRLEIFSRSASELGYFPALGAAFGEFAVKLKARWLPGTAEMPLYPAFRP